MSMKTVSARELLERIRTENPWWFGSHTVGEAYSVLPKRAYFDLFFPYVIQRDPRRALILMGPRRIGKTVMLFQSIQALIDSGVKPTRICYLDLQTPLYSGLSLERLLELFKRAAAITDKKELFVFFDEIQYLPNWEVHLKNLVDRFPEVKFIGSGSAAAALRLKSQESGAGRFTDFLLPPVTFYEYLNLIQAGHLIAVDKQKDAVTVQWSEGRNLEAINAHFVDYINFGGYPEAIFSPIIRSDPSRYIRNDIVDKVLMKDLPSLYGIHDIQELNSLFTMLAYNTGCEISLDALSSKAGVAKNTIKRYIEYLESAFLIKIVHRIDRSAKRFIRANFFKVYLTNPCIRAALFFPLEEDGDGFGSLVETAIFAQWFHWLTDTLHYARWDAGAGEVDIVKVGQKTQKPLWALEVRWTNSCINDRSEVRSLSKFLEEHPKCEARVTTKSESGTILVGARTVDLWPSAIYCYWVGWHIIQQKRDAKMKVSLVAE
jgi:predicted AAA+ superfamily ATPase